MYGEGLQRLAIRRLGYKPTGKLEALKKDSPHLVPFPVYHYRIFSKHKTDLTTFKGSLLTYQPLFILLFISVEKILRFYVAK